MSSRPVEPTRYRVHLINPPSAPDTVANREGAAGMGTLYTGSSAFLYPPHTLALVAACLREAGYAVRAFDALVEDLPPDVYETDVMGIFVAYASLETDLAFITRLRERTSARLFAFGPAMRFVGPQVLERAPLDAVLVGDAEGFASVALPYVLGTTAPTERHLYTPASVGAAGLDDEGFVQDLDGLPFPAWDLLPYEHYAMLTVLSSRGCPDHCAYCPYAAAQGHSFRCRTAQSVVNELAWLSERFHPARLVFRDPVFSYDPQRVAAICEGILRRSVHLHWECESRPEHFSPELLRLMQRAGCRWVKIGLETTDATLLQQLRRVGSAEEVVAYVEQVNRIVRACAHIGLNCRLFVMAGLPGGGTAAAEETGRFVTALRPTALNVKEFDTYPGLAVQAAAATDATPGEAAIDVQEQMRVLRTAQTTIEQTHPSPGALDRGKRMLRDILRGGRRG